ncbi:MAG: hypothetical protein P4M12_02655 [Gammaproteobacteria bacterium]|nr:hypothetical protein [Gammaproteobacteria bacterium]
MTTPFTDYSDTAPADFKNYFDSLRNTYKSSSDGEYYSSRIGSYLTGALTALNAALKISLTDTTPSTITTYVLPCVVFASGITYFVCNLVETNTKKSLETQLTLGKNNGFFKTAPDIEQSLNINATTLLDDGLSYRVFKKN